MYRSAIRAKLFINVSRREGTSRLYSQPLLQNLGVASTASLHFLPALRISCAGSLRHFSSDVDVDSSVAASQTSSSKGTVAGGANVAGTAVSKPTLHEVYTLKAHQAMSRGNATLGRSIMGEMRANGHPPSMESMNELLSVIDVQNNTTLCQKYFDEITEFGMTPNLSSFHRLAHSFARVGDVPGVEKVLASAKAAGHEAGAVQ